MRIEILLAVIIVAVCIVVLVVNAKLTAPNKPFVSERGNLLVVIIACAGAIAVVEGLYFLVRNISASPPPLAMLWFTAIPAVACLAIYYVRKGYMQAIFERQEKAKAAARLNRPPDFYREGDALAGPDQKDGDNQ